MSSEWFFHWAIAASGALVVKLSFLSQADLLIIIIIITYRPMLYLLKPEWAERAVAAKDSSYNFLGSLALISILAITTKVWFI